MQLKSHSKFWRNLRKDNLNNNLSEVNLKNNLLEINSDNNLLKVNLIYSCNKILKLKYSELPAFNCI